MTFMALVRRLPTIYCPTLCIPAFVVCTCAKRLLFRVGLAQERGPYKLYRTLFINNLPEKAELHYEYHALVVRHGKEVCGKKPACKECCLLDICPTGHVLQEEMPQSCGVGITGRPTCYAAGSRITTLLVLIMRYISSPTFRPRSIRDAWVISTITCTPIST